MKKLAKNMVLCMQPVPQTIVSCRDKDGNNNALVVGFTANVSLDPVMVMVGIVPTRHSHHIGIAQQEYKNGYSVPLPAGESAGECPKLPRIRQGRGGTS